MARSGERTYTRRMPSSVLFVIACLIWGSTFYAITLQLGEVAPVVSVVYRFALASIVLFGWCLARGDKLVPPRKALFWIMLHGFATFGLSYLFTYSSEQYLVSALVAVLFALMVFWNPICSRLFFGTPLSLRTYATGSLAVLGVIILFWNSITASLNEIMSGGTGHFLLGLGMALMATICSTVGNTLVVKARQHTPNVLLTMAWGMLFGTLLSTSWAVITGASFALPTAPKYWGGLLYLSLFGSVIAFACYFTLIHRLGTQKAVYIGVVTPVISVLLSIRLENFRPGPLEWLGMALCLSSVAWALRTPGTPAASQNLTLKKAS